MKKQLFRAILICSVIVCGILLCASCNNNQGGNEPLIPMKPEFLSESDISYTCQDGSVLSTYNGKTEADFEAVDDYYKALGYETYSESVKNGSRFSTLVNGENMTHIYYLEDRGELNVVTSDTAGATLPPKTPAAVGGEYEVTVTQMKDPAHVNGMGYVIRLADGSFIVYDGSYADRASKLMQYLKILAGDEKIVIRAWVITHSHNDHYPAFHQFAEKYNNRVKLEYVIVSPIDPEVAVATGGDTYFNEELASDIARFKGAKTVYAHTGMNFTFCNLNMEILLSPDDLFKNAGHMNNFNNSSIVSRLYDEDYSFLLTADIGSAGSEWMTSVYGDYLQSDMCQVSHHGVEDVPLNFYEVVKAPILFYPCNQYLYDLDSRFNDVRAALREKEYTKEILIAGLERFTRVWGVSFEDDEPLSMPGYVPPTVEE